MSRPATPGATGPPSASDVRLSDLDLGWRSHLIAHGAADVEEHADCIVVRTPDRPDYYWGNCLIVPAAPRDAELAAWVDRFAQAFPDAGHVAIGVNAGALVEPLPAWEAAGFAIDETAVLALEPAGLTPKPEIRADAVTLRDLRLPEEAARAVDLQGATEDTGFAPAAYRLFRTRLMAHIATQNAAGRAFWFGAFVGDVLAADCGLAHDGRIGRFQHVETHPAFRRLGLCRALVHHVCRYGFERLGLERLVMCADPHDVAIGIYRAVGFAPCGTQWQLCRRAPADIA